MCDSRGVIWEGVCYRIFRAVCLSAEPASAFPARTILKRRTLAQNKNVASSGLSPVSVSQNLTRRNAGLRSVAQPIGDRIGDGVHHATGAARMQASFHTGFSMMFGRESCQAATSVARLQD